MKKEIIALTLSGVSLSLANAETLKTTSAPIKENNRPNIIFLMADDHQAMALGCMGNKEVYTPNLDAFADQSLIFDKAYATSPICMPSRASVMTGMYEFKTGSSFSTGSLQVKDWKNNSYPMLLKKSGYSIAFAGKWGFRIEDKYDYSKDFDAWGGFRGSSQGSYLTKDNLSLVKYAEKYPHVTRALGAFGKDYIKNAVKVGKPFCLSISFKAPHKPHLFIDKEDETLFKGIKFSTGKNYGDAFSKLLPPQAKLSRQRALWNEWAPGEFQKHIKKYYQLIAGIDSAVKMILDELKALNIDKKTVIIYTSDNGYALGAHGLQGKSFPYEEMSRIPLIIYDPNAIAHGNRTSSLVANIDFAPTILDYAGVSIPKKMDGKSLKPLLEKNPKIKVHESILLIQNWAAGSCDIPKAMTVVSGAWKYTFWSYGDKNISPQEELFNIIEDPIEIKNKLKTSPSSDILESMHQKYDQYLHFWSENARPEYVKNVILYDRNIPWQQKKFKGTRGKFVTKEMYREYAGAEPAKGLIKERKNGKNWNRRKNRKKRK
jgi:arylsulfatase A-like enzyme